MSTMYAQGGRNLAVMTALGPDVLLLRGLSGREAISELFRFRLDLLAEHGVEPEFHKLLGQGVGVRITMPGDRQRFLHGVCSRFAEVGRDSSFTFYRLEMVPQAWFLTLKTQSRIFQHRNVPEILRSVLEGLAVDYDLRGSYPPRDYCVQYRETDFAFAARLMEEEGISYYFRHEDGSHRMVVTDSPAGFVALPTGSRIEYERSEAEERHEDRITQWMKSQELRSGQVTLWDHCFELPGKHLEADSKPPEKVMAGTVEHTIKIGRNDRLELYDYPGGYAGRFDGVDPGGGDRPSDLEKIFTENKRAAQIRMQEEAGSALTIEGSGHCRGLVAGHRFTLSGHHNGDGEYLVTSVEHEAKLAGDYRSNGPGEIDYRNRFQCLPSAVSFRPRRLTPRPVVQGAQSAVVVGPAGEEIYTDKYGRVKVQFPWDREGKHDSESSCWIRVGTPWAGGRWGVVHIPRIGHEVIVAFEEGDPDRPIIVGSVYNADRMPPFKLPEGKVISGVKSDSTPGGGGYNEISLDDTKGKERITIHAQRDMGTTVLRNDTQTVYNDRTIQVVGKHTETIKKATSITVSEGPYSLDVAANTATIHVASDVKETFDANQLTIIGGALTEQIAKTQTTTVQGAIAISSTSGQITLTGANQIVLSSGGSTVTLKKDGTIEISGKKVSITGTDELNLSGAKISIAGKQEVVMGVGGQTVRCSPAEIVVSGAALTASATGIANIKGALVKIN